MKWVKFSTKVPEPEDMIVIRDDGDGNSFKMRVPCRRYEQIMERHPGIDLEYRLDNSPRIDDDVRFAYPINGISEAKVVARNGSYVYLEVQLPDRKIEIERYPNELTVLRDERYNDQYGE